MPPLIDLTGQRFGKLTVIERSRNRGTSTIWKCRCDCGNIRDVWAGSLRSGHTTSCGCLGGVFKDLNGKRFTRLKVIRRLPDKVMPNGAKNVMWLCICDCGKLHPAQANNLQSGNTKSCGCLRREATSKRLLDDLTGQQFGLLTVIKRAKDRGGRVAWLCTCTCGRDKVVTAKKLKNGETKSCGCMRRRTDSSNPLWKGFGEIPGEFWSVLRWSASSRSLPLEVSMEECWKLYMQHNGKCVLSGVEIGFRKGQARKSGTTASLDRIDSRMGYVAGNIQWVHKVVNRMKGKLDQDRFLELCSLVAEPIRHNSRSRHCAIGKKHGNFKGYGNIPRKYWQATLRQSRREGRQIQFSITIEQGWRKFLRQDGWCALTGLELDWDDYRGKNEKGKQGGHKGSASIDRIHSNRGYTIRNIQWVYKDVNAMKWNVDEWEFKEWCKLVADFNRR